MTADYSTKKTLLTRVISMNQTMEKLEKMPEAEYSSFIRVLFGLSSPSPVAPDLAKHDEFKDLTWFDPSLNDSQKDAIRFALASREVALVHGPPGVGAPRIYDRIHQLHTDTGAARPARLTP